MRWLAARRSIGLYAALIGGGLAVCGWHWGEHRRFREVAAQSLINRGRDITSTLGIVVSSQRRFGNLVAKERIESALQALIHPGELESIAILGATGETIASAGRPIEQMAELSRAGGVLWREKELTLMNLMDLGLSGGVADDRTLPAAVVVSGPRMTKALRSPPGRGAGGRSAEGRPTAGSAGGTGGEGSQVPARFPYARPAWMDQEEFDALIRTQGVHSLVISLSTGEMRRLVRGDFLLRSMVSLLAAGAAVISALAWRNFSRNSELQIRLIKAGEMNSHLAQMNFAAAGLAHETRNPLNLIRGLAQSITHQAGDAPKLREHASAIIEEADRVTVQLNQFIDYSKPRQAHLAPVDVPRLVADVARTLLPDLEDKQITFEAETAPLTVAADEQLFRQALFNLMLNAVQAVESGGQIAVRWRTTENGEATLEIRDNGPGVAETDRTEIFKPYVTKRPKGVGLGLAIVQQIVAAHHWEIACLPLEPRGANFRLSHLRPAAPG
jgi:signal transduction histidine kinase